MELVVTRSVDGAGFPVIRLEGALDLLTRNSVVSAVEEAFADSPGKAVVLDIGAVTFIDSTGVGALLELASDGDDNARRLLLRNPSPRVSRILALTGLTDRFAVQVDPHLEPASAQPNQIGERSTP